MDHELLSLDAEVQTFCDKDGTNSKGLLLAIGACLTNKTISKEAIVKMLSPVIETLEEHCHV